jgi:hypothetical protein
MDPIMFMAFANKEDAINEIIRTGSKDTDTWREILRKHGWELWDLSEYEISEILRRIENN